jgi:hypothetical protein
MSEPTNETPFPRPEWPPIQSLDSIDIIGARHDGALNMIIVASQPLDDSPVTLDSIHRKVQTYLTAIGLEEFQAEMGRPPREKICIIITCEHPIHPRALAVITRCHAIAAEQGIRLELRKSTSSPPIPLPQEGQQVEHSIRPATEADRRQIAAHVAVVLGMLRPRYPDAQFHRTEEGLRLLQRLQDDGLLLAGREAELESVGIAFGEVLAARTPLEWVTVEWEGERGLGLQYPNTTIIVFPGDMIAKRVNRGERVDFASLFASLMAQVEQMKDDPDYRRQAPATSEEEPEPSEELLDLIFAALEVGVETVRATNSGMHPFLMTPGDGKPAYTRFVDESIQRCIEMAQKAASELPAGVPAYAIAIDGYLPTEEEKFDAIIVEAAERGQSVGFVFAQRYRPAREGKAFEVVGRPAIIKTMPGRFG